MQTNEAYESFIHKSRYARYLDDEQRREDWGETVDRYLDYMKARYPQDMRHGIPWQELRQAIYEKDVMPSMRAMWTAGEALDRDQAAGFNCSYLAIDHPRAFDEVLYLLACGTGVGFSVERQYINKLPEVPEELHPSETVIIVPDSKIGWASSLRQLISLLYAGHIPKWDTSRVRPAGAKLKTFGGTASGPEPLVSVFRFVVATFQKAKGRRLNSLECHDMVCKIADAIICGGVRRSALISLSNLTDERMRNAKMGDFGTTDPQRYLANNSVAYTEKPDIGIFMKEWQALYQSKAGERGLFNRVAAQKTAPERRERADFGTNPCGEITLRSCQFCNLSEVVVRPWDTAETLEKKVRLAAILGTLQSGLTNFRYLRPIWQKNTEEECLLGVSLTGIMDNPLTRGDQGWGQLGSRLSTLRDCAVETNAKLAPKLGLNVSAAVTCVKPSGTVSQLVSSASGIHPWYAPYFIRRVRQAKHDPISRAMIEAGVPHEEQESNPSQWVFSFPMRAPEGVPDRKAEGAIRQLERWLVYMRFWAEHQVSSTIYVQEHEWIHVAAWVYEHFDQICGLSFLPAEDDAHVYTQAPYEEISKEEYDRLVAEFPEILDLVVVEAEDNTTGAQELACVAGVCGV